MTMRLKSVLLKGLCAAAAACALSSSAEACLFSFFWHHHGCCGPSYGSFYGPVSTAPACNPCVVGGGAVRTFSIPAAGCCPTACSPCGPFAAGCPGGDCGVRYAPSVEPIPDDGAGDDSGDRRTFVEEEPGLPSDTDTTPPDDDFSPPQRGEDGSEGEDPFPQNFQEPVLPMEAEEQEEPMREPEPMSLDDENITLRVSPVRHRVRVEARYRAPRITRIEVTPASPSSRTPTAAQIARNN